VPETSRRSSLSGAIVWFGASYGVALIGYLGINAIASRLLGPGEFGYFVIAVSLTTVIGQMGLIGTHRAGLRDAARLESGDRQLIQTLRRGIRGVSLVTLPVTGLLAGAATWAVATGYSSHSRLALSLGVLVLVVLGGQQKLWANYLRGFGHIRLASLLEGRSGGAAVSLLQAVLLLAVYEFAPHLGLVGAICAVALGYVPPILLAWRWTAVHWKTIETPWTLYADTRLVLTRNWRFASVQLGTYVNANLELWIASLFLTSVDTSRFGAADRLVLLLVVPMTSLQVVFSPAVARLAGTDPGRTERLVRTGATLATLVTAFLWVPMLVAPGWLLGVVYGKHFEAAGAALMILTLGYMANVLSGLSGTVLAMSDREGTVAAMNWWAVLLRVALAVPAGLLLGIKGLAASEAFVSTVLSLVLWWHTRSVTGIRTHVTLRPSIALARRTAG
jgi:O-antigen/teichoic acid export membrane protein